MSLGTRKLVRGLVIAMLAGLLLVVLQIPGLRPADFLSRRWRQALPTLPEKEVMVTMRALADLGVDQLQYVTAGLTSQRPAISAASRTVIKEQLARWKMLAPRESSQRVALLASQVAAVSGGLDQPNREFAADLAGQLLRWPVDRQSTSTIQLLRDCETILLAGAITSHHPMETVSGSSNENEPSPSAISKGPARRSLSDTDRSATSGLPTVPSETIPPRVIPSASLPRTPLGNSFESQVPPPPDGGGAETDSNQNVSESAAPSSLRLNDDTRMLIQQLHSTNLSVASRAIRRLRQKGFQDRDFELASRLDDPDPEVRRQLAESIAGLSGIDPQPWFLWLSRDSDASVRRAVASIMATSDDPLLIERLQAMERQDADEEVVLAARRGLRR